MNKNRDERAIRAGRLKDAIAVAVALTSLGAGLFGIFQAVDSWAALSFSRPSMASALVAVIDAALLAIALCLTPLVSKLARMSLGR